MPPEYSVGIPCCVTLDAIFGCYIKFLGIPCFITSHIWRRSISQVLIGWCFLPSTKPQQRSAAWELSGSLASLPDRRVFVSSGSLASLHGRCVCYKLYVLDSVFWIMNCTWSVIWLGFLYHFNLFNIKTVCAKRPAIFGWSTGNLRLVLWNIILF